MSFFIALAIAVLPAVLLLIYIFKKDAKPEPKGKIWKAILLGAATVIPIICVEQFVSAILFGEGGAVCVGLGFATVENIGYVVLDDNWASVGIMRAIFSVPGHYAFAVLMGFYYAQYHFVKRSFLNGVSILAVPVIAHGIYDSIVMNVGISDYLVLPIIVLLIVFCIWMHKKCKKKIMAQLALDKAGEISA